MIINKKLEDIEESDLQALINDQVSEGKTIEYKASMPSNADDQWECNVRKPREVRRCRLKRLMLK